MHTVIRNQLNAGRARHQGLALAALFFGSLGLAFVLYYGLDWAPGANAAHGRLIHPAQPLGEFTARTVDGTELQLQDLKGRWSIVYVNAGACGEPCRATLVRLRQVWLTFGRDMPRFQTLLVSTGAAAGELWDPRAVHPELTALGAAEGLLDQLRAAAPQAIGGSVLLVDPLGNLMMQYPGGFEQKGLQSDLKRLLKYSHIG